MKVSVLCGGGGSPKNLEKIEILIPRDMAVASRDHTVLYRLGTLLLRELSPISSFS